MNASERKPMTKERYSQLMSDYRFLLREANIRRRHIRDDWFYERWEGYTHLAVASHWSNEGIYAPKTNRRLSYTLTRNALYLHEARVEVALEWGFSKFRARYGTPVYQTYNLPL